jgi:LPXTG-motif cell wall-anchored protein
MSMQTPMTRPSHPGQCARPGGRAARTVVAVLLLAVAGLGATVPGSGPAAAGAPTMPAATATMLTTDRNPSVLGDSVFFLASVTSDGVPVTVGTVDFTVDDVALASDVPLDAGGYAGVSTSALPVGDHAIVATYDGTADFATSLYGLYQTVEAPPAIEAPTAISVSSSRNPAAPGDDVSFLITVTSDGAPVLIGTVDITIDGAPFIDDAAVDAGGFVSFTTSFATVGTRAVVVAYDPNPAYAASTASLDQVVVAPPVDPDPDPTVTTAPPAPTSTSTSTSVVPVPTTAPPGPGATSAPAGAASTGTLPRTGPTSALATVAGAGLLVTGSVLLLAARRRRAS